MLESKAERKKEKTWLELINEHPLRHDIWMVLELYHELNVTEITQYVKRSKSTVSRVLIGMENDELLISRRAKKGKGEKIPPKFFRINPKFKKLVDEWDEENLPEEPEKLQEFYNSKIDKYRKIIKDLEKRFEYLKILLKYFREQIADVENIEFAKSIYKEFLSDINEPSCTIMHIDDKRYKEFLDLRIEYMMKLQKLLLKHELDEDNAIVYFDMSLPYSALFELTKKLKAKKSIK